MSIAPEQPARWHRYWDKKSKSYDKEMGFWDRWLFGDTREWACSRAEGTTLEVAIGTGLNLPFYPAEVELTGLDLSQRMLDIAIARASELGRSVDLRQGNAHALPFADASFDTVVCTFGLCAIPDADAALDEMVQVLRPGGLLILADHVPSTSRLARGVQRVLEVCTVRLGGEHFLRRPSTVLTSRGLETETIERFGLGLVERLVARKTA
jgi:ubiquinone/menaquinone biosynthesis C-methylase UbiE